MCAIVGFINCGDAEVLKQVRDVQAHRGPDANGQQWWEAHGSGFAHRRLSILDLSPAGHQPMATPDGRYWITFNGEIYNFQDIRRRLEGKGLTFRSTGDTEVILRAYEVWGADCLKEFNGMFAFAIFDSFSGRLFAARDHIGIKPFYYWHEGDRLAFASEIKALLRCPFIPRAPDLDSLATPARFQISPATGFTGIKKMPPAHYMIFERGQLKLACYWQIRPREDVSPADGEAADQLDALLTDAVRLQMISDRPVGTFLSGGLDSSIISALMRKHTRGDIHAFTISFSAEDQKYERAPNDSFYAKKVSERFSFQFHEFELRPAITELLPKMVWHLDEPLSDPATINTYMISQAARDLGIVVLLNGVGGDEVFAGYRKHLACLKAEMYRDLVPMMLQRQLQKLATYMPVATGRGGLRYLRWMKRFMSFASMPEVERYLASDLSLPFGKYQQLFPSRSYFNTWFWRAQQPNLTRGDLSYLCRMCLNDTSVFLPEHNLTYSDKAAMAASVETRPPLTDYRIVQMMFSLPPDQRIRGRTQKWLLKKVAERYLPAEIVHRPKAPFNAPLRAWMRGPLAPMVDELLSEASLRQRGFYEPLAARNLIETDRRGIEDNGMVIWTMLTTELWFRTFIDPSHV